jgi:CBS domain containing-hemolysin-like protein
VRLPEPGEVVDVDGHRFEVLAVDDARLVELRITESERRGD